MNEKTVPVRSARELAEELLAFREAYAPDNKRFHERALLVDNGGRGSDQKAVVFTGDDLSALLMDLRCAEADLAALRQRHAERTCDSCRYRAVVLETGGTAGDPDYENDWCCVMPDSLSVDEIEAMGAPGAVNTLCTVFGNYCGAWKGKTDA